MNNLFDPELSRLISSALDLVTATGIVPVGSKPFNKSLEEAVFDIVTEFLRPIRKCRAVED